MESQQLGPEVRVLPLDVKNISSTLITVQVARDHGTVQGLGGGVLELSQLAGGKVPGEVGLLLPGVAVVVLVLVDEGRALGALPGEVLHLGRHPAGVPLHPDLSECGEAHHPLSEVANVAPVAVRRLTVVERPGLQFPHDCPVRPAPPVVRGSHLVKPIFPHQVVLYKYTEILRVTKTSYSPMWFFILKESWSLLA